MPNSRKEYHLVDLLTGESLGGFVSLAGARDEARAAGLTRWDIFQGNLRIERHDPGINDPIPVAIQRPEKVALPIPITFKSDPDLLAPGVPISHGLVVKEVD
jgi:hypothetical protein